MTAILYARVSTKNGQSVQRQIDELQVVAEKSGWDISEILCDEGISGAKGRKDRPAFDKALKLITQRKADRLMVWSVDRLGRSLKDLVETMEEINAAGADLYIHTQALDTSTPAGRAMFGMLSIFSSFERELIRERVISGLDKALREGKRLGRKPIPPITKKKVIELRALGLPQQKIANKVGISTGKVCQILKEVTQTSPLIFANNPR